MHGERPEITVMETNIEGGDPGESSDNNPTSGGNDMVRGLTIALVLLGVTGVAEAAGAYFRIDAPGDSQYINLAAVTAISHSTGRTSREDVSIWMIGSPTPVRIPLEQQAAFWEAMRTHAQCVAATDTPCTWPVGPRPSLLQRQRQRR